MSTDRRKIHQRHLYLILLLLPLLLGFAGCSLPKIVVLHDPLSAEEHVKLGSIYDSQGKTGLARDQFREATRRDPKNIRAWSLLGDTAYKMKEFGDADKAYRKAIDLDPKNGDLRNNLAWVYMEQGRDLEAARELVLKALDLTPDHRPYYLDTLGVVLLKLGSPREAVVALKESAETIPPDRAALLAEAYGHLAEAYRATGDDAAAREAESMRELLLKKK